MAEAWDLAADNAAGNQCKAFGVGGIMRQPGRMRISWQDDQTLKLEFDAGTQTRLLHFDRRPKPPGREDVAGLLGCDMGRARRRPRRAAGRRRARCRRRHGAPCPGGGGQGLRGGPPPRGTRPINRGGDIKVVTTDFREGYLRKNGVPYSEQATITEYIHRLPTHPNGDNWLHVVTIVEDPRYLSQPFYTSTNFKLRGGRIRSSTDAVRDGAAAARRDEETVARRAPRPGEAPSIEAARHLIRAKEGPGMEPFARLVGGAALLTLMITTADWPMRRPRVLRDRGSWTGSGPRTRPAATQPQVAGD